MLLTSQRLCVTWSTSLHSSQGSNLRLLLHPLRPGVVWLGLRRRLGDVLLVSTSLALVCGLWRECSGHLHELCVPVKVVLVLLYLDKLLLDQTMLLLEAPGALVVLPAHYEGSRLGDVGVGLLAVWKRWHHHLVRRVNFMSFLFTPNANPFICSLSVVNWQIIRPSPRFEGTHLNPLNPSNLSSSHLLHLNFPDLCLPCCTCFAYQLVRTGKNKERPPPPKKEKKKEGEIHVASLPY